MNIFRDLGSYRLPKATDLVQYRSAADELRIISCTDDVCQHLRNVYKCCKGQCLHVNNITTDRALSNSWSRMSRSSRVPQISVTYTQKCLISPVGISDLCELCEIEKLSCCLFVLE